MNDTVSLKVCWQCTEAVLEGNTSKHTQCKNCDLAVTTRDYFWKWKCWITLTSNLKIKMENCISQNILRNTCLIIYLWNLCFFSFPSFMIWKSWSVYTREIFNMLSIYMNHTKQHFEQSSELPGITFHRLILHCMKQQYVWNNFYFMTCGILQKFLWKMSYKKKKKMYWHTLLQWCSPPPPDKPLIKKAS